MKTFGWSLRPSAPKVLLDGTETSLHLDSRFEAEQLFDVGVKLPLVRAFQNAALPTFRFLFMFPFSSRLLVVAALLAANAVTSSAYAQDSVSLSPPAFKRFDSQVRALQNTRARLSPSRRKLDSSLWIGLSSSSLRAKLPSLRVSGAPGARKLSILGRVTPRLIGQVARLGGTVLSSFPEHDELNVFLSPSAADALARLPEVRHIIPTFGAFTKRNLASVPSRTLAVGRVNSEGDTTHQAGAARSGFGVTGKAIKIGVISDSVDFLGDSQQAGELGTVTVLSDQPGSGEGTAMLEIHDLAPDSPLFFATAGDTAASMARSIKALTDSGCKIIVDDIGFFNEPVFQDGVVSRAISAATARGVLYLSAGGNDGRRSFGLSQTWEGLFVDGGTPGQFGLPLDSRNRLHSFSGRSGSGVFNRLVRAGNQQIRDLFLWWAEPVGRAENDYDLFVLDAEGNILNASTNVQNGDGLPFESLFDGGEQFLTEGNLVAITRFNTAGGTNRRLPMRLFSNSARFSNSTRGALYGHSASVDALCVAAAPAADPFPFEPNAARGPFPGPFVATSPLEPFSSDGPRPMFFAPDGSPKPVNLLKPDITAADGVVTSVPGFERFYGTSAAAPHAAAIAALVWSLDPSQTNAQIRTKLIESALRRQAWNPDAGFGIVMAPRALAAASAKLSVTSFSGREGKSAFNVLLSVSLPEALPYPVKVNFQTQDGTATAGVDYIARSGTVVIPANETSARFAVRILGDTAPESDETFSVVVSSSSVSSAPASGTVTIINDDRAPTDAPRGSNGTS